MSERSELTSDSADLRRLGPYELFEALGAGAMGAVYRARHTGLDRVVALKVLTAGGEQTAEALQRFRREARLMGELEHPGIVKVLDVGEDAGRHYIAMEFVAGETLAKLLERDLPSVERALRWMRDIAAAVGHAHHHGIIHRDLKPANILMCGGERPRVADFGLARELDSGVQLTRTRQVMGTPYYLAPETIDRTRARGPAATVDVYALGVVLFELLTGRRPFEAEHPARLMRSILHDEPPAPRGLDGRIPPAAEAICLKCLAKRPAERYPDALALAEDLERLLKLEAVAARPEARSRRWGRRLRDRPLVLGLLLLCLAAPLAAWGVGRWLEWRAALARYARVDRLDREARQQRAAGQLDAAAETYGRALDIWPEWAPACAGRRACLLALADQALATGQPGLARMLLHGLELEQPQTPGLGERRERTEQAYQELAGAVDRVIADFLRRIPEAGQGEGVYQEVPAAVREEYFTRLVALRHARTVGRLIEALTHPHPVVREIAAQVLRYHGDERALEPLLARTPRMQGDLTSLMPEPVDRVALAVIETLLALAPKDARVRTAVIVAFMSYHDLQDHLGPLLRRLPDIEPDPSASTEERAQLLLDQAIIHVMREEYEQGIACYDEAEALTPQRAQIFGNRGMVHDRVGNPEAALRDLSRAIELDPLYAGARLNRASLLFDQLRLDPALVDLNAILEQSPDNAMALGMRGCIHYMQGQAQGDQGRLALAEADLDRALRLDPLSPRLNFYLGQIYEIRTGAPERSIARYTRALELDPAYLEALLGRSRVLARLGRQAEARRDVERMLQLDPNHTWAWFRRAELEEEADELEAAAADFARAARLAAPDNLNALVRQTDVLRRLGRHDQAAALLAAAVQRFQGQARALVLDRLGRLRGDQGRPGEALALFAQAQALDPGLGEPWASSVPVLLALGRREEALTAVRRAVALDPDHAPYRVDLLEILLSLGRADDADDAERELAELERRAPNHVALPRLRGFLDLWHGRHEEALAAFDAALAGPPEEAGIQIALWINRAVCLLVLSRCDEAREALDRAEALGGGDYPELRRLRRELDPIWEPLRALRGR